MLVKKLTLREMKGNENRDYLGQTSAPDILGWLCLNARLKRVALGKARTGVKYSAVLYVRRLLLQIRQRLS